MIEMDARTVADMLCSGDPLPLTTVAVDRTIELHPLACPGHI